MARVEYESWVHLQPVKEATVHGGTGPASSSHTADGPTFALDTLFDTPSRGFPKSEELLFGDLSAPELVRTAVAPCGGLVAVYPAPITAAVTPVPELERITVTNPSGSKVTHIPLQPLVGGLKGSLVAVGWTAPELLLCITSKGVCTAFNPQGRPVHTFHVAERSHEVAHACIHHSCVVALAYTGPDAPPKVLLTSWAASLDVQKRDRTETLNGGAALPVPEDGVDASVTGEAPLFEAMALQAGPPLRTSSGMHLQALQVLLACSTGGLLVVSREAAFHIPFPWTAATLAVSPASNRVAAVTKPGRAGERSLHVLAPDLSTETTPSRGCSMSVQLKDLHRVSAIGDAPFQPENAVALSVAWVAEAAVAVAVKLTMPDGFSSHSLFVLDAAGCGTEVVLEDDEVCHLAPELDGAVVLGEHSWSLLRDVPAAVQRTVGPGASDPAALLLAASRYYSERDAKCETILSSIRDQPGALGTPASPLTVAVMDCLVTAGWLHGITSQKDLLKAVIYARSHFPEVVDAAQLPLTVLHCRVLNTLHIAGKTGRGTTRQQLEWLILHEQLQYLGDVLCGCHSFGLALDLASDPDLPLATGPVLLSWSRTVIDRMGHDKEACMARLRQQLESVPGVYWATVAGYAREKSFPELGEELLALDPRDSHVIPQLMRLQRLSTVALSKALLTCSEDLVLLVLLHSYEEAVLEQRALEGGPPMSTLAAFYSFLMAASKNTSEVMHEQAYNIWHSFVHSTVVPLPDVRMDLLKVTAMMEHGNYAYPLHRTLLMLSEVLVSTAGPPREGQPPGATKGRAHPLTDWNSQQKLLFEEARLLQGQLSDIRQAPPDSTMRGLSSLVYASKSGRHWQSQALKRFYALRERQQKLEADVQVQLVGLSVLDTARKLKLTRKDAQYEAFLREFLPDGHTGRAAPQGTSGPRASKLAFAVECDVLGGKQLFDPLLAKIEQSERARLSDDRIKMVVETCLRNGVHQAPEFETDNHQPTGRVTMGYRERMGNVMNWISNQDTRQALLDNMQLVSGQHRTSADHVDQVAGPMALAQGLSAMGGAIMHHAGSMGQMLGQSVSQGAGQVRDRLRR